MSVWTCPCLHAHTGAYVDANSFPPARLGGRPYVPAGTQTCVFANTQSKQTRAPTGTRKHVCKRENETKCARTRRNGLGMRLLARAHTRVYANRHLSVCAHGSVRGQSYICGNTFLQHTHGPTHAHAGRDIRAHSQGHAPCAIARARKQMRAYALACLATICVCKRTGVRASSHETTRTRTYRDAPMICYALGDMRVPVVTDAFARALEPVKSFLHFSTDFWACNGSCILMTCSHGIT